MQHAHADGSTRLQQYHRKAMARLATRKQKVPTTRRSGLSLMGHEPTSNPVPKCFSAVATAAPRSISDPEESDLHVATSAEP
ncbi:hypothetical protein VTH82DRAFT_7892 [Thermothelomyces myriococcoides]